MIEHLHCYEGYCAEKEQERLHSDSTEWEARYRHLHRAVTAYVTEPSEKAMNAVLAALEV